MNDEQVELLPAGAEQLYLWIALGLIALLGFGSLLFAGLRVVPAIRARNTLNLQLTSAQADLSAIELERTAVPGRLQSQLDGAQDRLQTVLGHFLSETEAAVALDSLYSDSRAAGVEIVDLQTLPGPTSELYTLRTFRLQAQAPLSSLLDFLASIREVRQRGFALNNVSIAPSGESHALGMDLFLYTSPFASAALAEQETLSPTPVIPTANLEELQQELEVAWRANDWPRAIQLAQQMRILRPGLAGATEVLYRAHVNQGYGLLAHRDAVAARTQFESALEIKPTGAEAQAELTQISRDPFLAVVVEDGLVRELDQAIAGANWSQAILRLRQLQIINPDFPDLSARLAVAYVSYGNQLISVGQVGNAQNWFAQAEHLQSATVTTDTNGIQPSIPVTATGIFAPTPTVVIIVQAPGATPTSTETPTPSPTLSPTPTLTPTPSTTPSETPTISPTPTSTPTPTATEIFTQTLTPTGSATSVASQTPVGVYIVQTGDTLYSLAQRFGTTVDTLIYLNRLPNTTIYVGQYLIVASASVVTPSVPVYRLHTVQRGDTLYSLAQRYNSTVQAIVTANGLRNHNIYVGQQLRIP